MKSYQQSSPTDEPKPFGTQYTETLTEKSTAKVYQVNLDSIAAAFREHIYEVNQMVTEAGFQR
jgi:hypothetical protein